MVKNGGIRKLVERSVDPEIAVSIAAIGALRFVTCRTSARAPPTDLRLFDHATDPET